MNLVPYILVIGCSILLCDMLIVLHAQVKKPGLIIDIEALSSIDKKLIKSAYDGNISGIVNAIYNGAHIEAEGEGGNTALIVASYQGYPEIVEMLLSSGAQVNAANNQGNTSLIYASLNGHDKVVEKLLQRGADIYHSNKEGDTALITSTKEGHEVVMQTLLIDIDIEKSIHEGAIRTACERAYINIVRMLLSHLLNVPEADLSHKAILLHAAQKGIIPVVRMMLEKGMSVDTQNSHGETPLHLAAKNNQEHMVTFLMNHGADPYIQDSKRKRAIDYAQEDAYNAISVILQPYMDTTSI